MTTVAVNQSYSASSKGLISDGNARTELEDSNVDESNYELLRDGTRRRRRPIIQETSDTVNYLPTGSQKAVSSFMWKTPAHRDNYSIVVEELNNFVKFYKVDHNSPSYVRNTEIADVLYLRLFGNRSRTQLHDITDRMDRPCKYAEGNGSLYIFNPISGTIKAELYDDNGTDRLRFTPIGTWIRDYEGATEQRDINARTVATSAINQWGAGQPFHSLSDPSISSELHPVRAYNLSNSGWTDNDLSKFANQSTVGYTQPAPDNGILTYDITYPGLAFGEYPALSERIATILQTQESGSTQLSYVQANSLRRDESKPGMGARIGHSDAHAAGTLVGEPHQVATKSSTIVAGVRVYDLTFDTPQYHTDSRSPLQMAVFMHFLSFTVDISGKEYQGGFTGVLDGGVVVGANGLQIACSHQSIFTNGVGAVNFQLVQAYAHPSPHGTPHSTLSFTGSTDNRFKDRPSTGAFYAGRLWQSQDEHNRLYFSQIVDSNSHTVTNRGVQQESLCYQRANPTSIQDNALVDTDGGYISLEDSGTHLWMEAIDNDLVLGTDNGIYVISAGSRGYFVPDDYSVRKISSNCVLGPDSVVNTGQSLHVVTSEGIIIVAYEKVGFGEKILEVASLTDNKIDTTFKSLDIDKRRVVGVYDSDDRKVVWAFPPQIETVHGIALASCPVLNYSLIHKAWFKYDLPKDGTIGSMVFIPSCARTTTYNNIRYLLMSLGGGIGSGNLLEVAEWAVEEALGPLGYGAWTTNHNVGERFVDYTDNGTFSIPRPATPAYMLTNSISYGGQQRWSQINYLTALNHNVSTGAITVAGEGTVTENIPGSTLLQARWDWTDDEVFGKYSPPQETYRFRRSYFPVADISLYNRGEPILVSKIKVRGRGREFKLYWAAQDMNDSHIEGWAIAGLVLSGV